MKTAKRRISILFIVILCNLYAQVTASTGSYEGVVTSVDGCEGGFDNGPIKQVFRQPPAHSIRSDRISTEASMICLLAATTHFCERHVSTRQGRSEYAFKMSEGTWPF